MKCIYLLVIGFSLSCAHKNMSGLRRASDEYINEAIEAHKCRDFKKVEGCILSLRGYVADEQTLAKSDAYLKETFKVHESIKPDDNSPEQQEGERLQPEVPKEVDRRELEAIRYYTGTWYGEMNFVLRGYSKLFSEKEPVILAAASFLNRLKSKVYVGAVTRSEGWSSRGLLAFKDLYKNGALVVEESFLSSEQGAENHFGAGAFAPIQVIFQINSLSGVDISDYSLIPAEREVLFVPGTVFKVKSLKQAKIMKTRLIEKKKHSGNNSVKELEISEEKTIEPRAFEGSKSGDLAIILHPPEKEKQSQQNNPLPEEADIEFEEETFEQTQLTIELDEV